MGYWAGDDRLTPTDKAILNLLDGGRETRGSLADHADKNPTTISKRLKWLQEWGYIRLYHEPTGLYELVPEEDRGEH